MHPDDIWSSNIQTANQYVHTDTEQLVTEIKKLKFIKIKIKSDCKINDVMEGKFLIQNRKSGTKTQTNQGITKKIQWSDPLAKKLILLYFIGRLISGTGQNIEENKYF